ncbi:DUF4365 domain-containing protein [Xanthomonas dyei]|uniref:DUF4365 domain-containing protein n=1 Tax=Xanthomonas dyei TaxID=743699 RepID=UPI001E65CE97|nr:DUF4365 domain-containing protein [Xanthomonas dyei]MCC4634310.1 DUF4365 domain-containing protein [Xanthomonas dyei pv. eucalypti]
MNLPKSQTTGRLAELAAERAFTAWGWNVGQDHTDMGYDLFVTPDYDTYQGVRFLVQVKGTASFAEKNPSAPVFRSRLRQYATDMLPVFILRVGADSTIYWIHAQAWAVKNQKVLKGEGKGRVNFVPSQTLADRAGFEGYLAAVCEPLRQWKDRLSVERDEHSLAPKGLGRTIAGQIPSPVIQDQPPAAHFSFQPVRTVENMALLRDAFYYGLPRSFDVESFNIEPPAGFPDLLKPLNLSQGKLTMKRHQSVPGHVFICSGWDYSVLSQELKVAADLFTGEKGIGITNELHLSPLDLTLRIAEENARFKADVNLAIRAKAMYGKPLRQFHDLAPLASWADHIAAEDAMVLSLDFGDTKEELSTSIKSLSNMLPVFQRIRSLSRLHMVARALKSDFTLMDADTFSVEDFQDIDFAYELLRGSRQAISLGPMEVDPISPEACDIVNAPGALYCMTQWLFEVAGRPVGEIPLEIDMTGYVLEKMEGSNKVLISKGEGAQAWVMHEKHTDTTGRIRRNRAS